MLTYHRLLISLFTLTSAQYFCLSTAQANTDFIIFSYDRPMQLYALLESTEHYLTGIASTTVLYRTSDERFARSYGTVQQRFPLVKFIAQSTDPKNDFKPLLLRAFKNGKSPYILFAPDDIIVKNYADLELCIQKMEEYGAYGFFLRLGTHLDTCYAVAKPQPLPPLTTLGDNLCSWKFKDGSLDWGYPNNVDMTIYRKNEIIKNLEASNYTSPNKMESAWASTQGSVSNRKGLCFCDSVIVNIPVNCVQKDYVNNHMNAWTTVQLLEFFETGKKIDITQLKGIKNKSCHINHELTFIPR